MTQPIGFLVWNPSRGTPTVQHATYERACAEAARLRRENPGQSFYVMAPVVTPTAELGVKAFSAGLEQGRAEMRSEVFEAERRLDKASEKLRWLAPIEQNAAEHQSTVADCLCWFDGFAAAHAHQEPWQRPSIPDRSKIRDLNAALQRVTRLGALDEDIPF